MPNPLSAHNAVTAVVVMYGEIVAGQAAENAELRRRNDELMGAIAALGEQLKEQALGRFSVEGVASPVGDPCGWTVPAEDDRPEDTGAEPAEDLDDMRDMRGGEGGGEPDGPGEGADSEVRGGPPAPGRPGPEGGPGDEDEVVKKVRREPLRAFLGYGQATNGESNR